MEQQELWRIPAAAILLLLSASLIFFATPLLHLLLFFTPLLVSTALCVMALVSIGPQIDRIREERQFKLSAAASSALPAPPPPRYTLVFRPNHPPQSSPEPHNQNAPQIQNARRRTRWADWVKGMEIQGSTIWLSQTHLMRDIGDEGLSSDFSHPDGGIPLNFDPFSSGNSGGAFSAPEARGKARGKFRDIVKLRIQGSPEIDSEQKQQEHAGDCMALVPVVEDDLCNKQEQVNDALIAKDHLAAAAAATTTTRKFMLTSKGAGKGSRRKMPWFRRRRMPCLSKALGQLRERICLQIRRIFS